MLVSNSQGMRAIVIRHDGKNVRLVALKPGRLGTSRYTREKFEAEWTDSDHPLPLALEEFLAYAGKHGSTVEALKGLEALVQRDRCVVNTLF
ncbi:MAG: hypothetical protein H6R10_2384 [Rhodocyclaceae bacterium]|nr:hypothetical protein [Rhodocyclaceae bacterium]